MDGGPAFPVEVDNEQPDGRQTGHTMWQSYGMSLRDYFAAHAPLPPKDMNMEDHCAFRWRYADAMLAARTPSEKGGR